MATVKSENKYCTTAAAICSAFVSVSVGFPLDVLKVRLQTSYYRSFTDCLKITVKEDGFRALYRGIIPVMFTAAITRSLSFHWYIQGKEFYQKQEWNPSYSYLFGGFYCGLLSSFLIGPYECIKVIRQTSSLSTKTVIKGLYNRYGIRGFFIGFPTQVGRDVLATTAYFGIYEYMNVYLANHNFPSWQRYMISGSLSGALAWVIIFPIDVIKSTIQRNSLKYRSTWSEVLTKRSKEGYSFLYRGLYPTLIRAIPLHAVNFLIYENVIKLCSGEYRKEL